jgi:hypothetical protein
MALPTRTPMGSCSANQTIIAVVMLMCSRFVLLQFCQTEM